MESPRINLCIYGKQIFYKIVRNAQGGKDRLFKQWCWENCIFTCKRMEQDLLDIGLNNDFLDMTPKAQAVKQK